MRVPHFVGMHALQVLPLAGLVFGRRLRKQPLLAAHLTRILGYGYLGLTLATLLQALRGQPVLTPDAFTWAMGLSVLAACGIAAAFVLARNFNRSAVEQRIRTASA